MSSKAGAFGQGAMARRNRPGWDARIRTLIDQISPLILGPRDRRREWAELERLDARTLKDIGISRDELGFPSQWRRFSDER